MGRFQIVFPYILFTLMIALVIFSNLRERKPSPINYAEAIQTMAALGDDSVSAGHAPDPSICQHCGITITVPDEVAGENDIKSFRFCSPECKEMYLRGQISRREKKKSSRILDPVCGMEVNPTWGISHDYEGATFHFCTEMCRNAFAAAPLAYLAERCMVCRRPVIIAKAFPGTYLGETYYLCSENH